MRTDSAVLLLDTETETKAAPDLQHMAGETITKLGKHQYVCLFCAGTQDSLSGPAGVHLDDLTVSGPRPQQPGVPSVLQRAAVVWAAVTVEDVVAMETLHAADLLQLEVLGFVGEVEGPQRRLLQDNSSTAV